MKIPIKTKILPKKIAICANPIHIDVGCGLSNPNKGSVQPPQNNVTIMAEAAIILAYSPMKKSANFIELYSVLYPATSSCSDSGRSKGSRLVSAKDEIIKIMKEMGA